MEFQTNPMPNQTTPNWTICISIKAALLNTNEFARANDAPNAKRYPLFLGLMGM